MFKIHPLQYSSFLPVAFVAMLMSASLATSRAAADGPGTIKAELRVAATDILAGHHILWMRTGPESDPVQLPLNIRTFSGPIVYQGLPQVQIFATEALARAVEPGEKPLLTTTLASGSSLLVFLPAQGTYRVLSVAGSDFPYGSFRFANLTKTMVRTELGKEGANLVPGASKTFAYTQPQASIGVRLFARTEGNSVRLLRQTNWSISLNQRELVLFFVNPETALVQTRHFVDSGPPPADAISMSVSP